MTYLRKKLQAIMASADFKGYLRKVTGTDSVTLTDCMGSDMTSLSLVGNAIQDGTPSPDNPVEIQGCGDRTANLFDVSRHTGFDGNSVTITNTSGANWQGQAFNIDYAVEFGKTYTYSVDYVIDNAADYSTIRFGYITANTGTVMTIGDIIAIHGSGTFVHTVTVPESIDNFDYFVLYANSSGGNPAVGDKITISNIQILEGSYTAETAPDYEPYGYKIPVEVSGRNLFTTNGRTELQLSNSAPTEEKPFEGNNILLNISSNGHIAAGRIISYTVAGNSVSLTVSDNSGYGVGFDFDVKPGEVYSLSCVKETEYAEVSISFYDTNGIYISRWYSSQSPFTVPENGAKMVLTVTRMYVNGLTGTETTETISNIMLVKGSYTAATIPPYEPYHAPQMLNVYMDKPLYATGDVGDEIMLDFEHKTATRTDKIRQLKDFEVSHCAGIPRQTEQCIHLAYNNVDEGGVDGSPVLSTHFVNVLWVSVSTDAQNEGIAWYPSGYNHIFYIYLNKTRIDMTADDTTATLATKCNAYIQTLTGREAYYQLLTPATTDISAMQDWDTIPKLWRGTAIATVKTTVPTKTITAQYYAAKKED